MKILLDECITKQLKNHLKEFNVFRVNELGWSGIKNGKLMGLCVDNGFDILLTIDKNLVFQQNINQYKLTIVIFNCNTSKIGELIEFIPSFKAKITSFEKHKAYFINK